MVFAQCVTTRAIMPEVFFMEKLCIKCQIVKPASEFGKDKLRSDGLFPYCKRCRSKNPEKLDEWQENKAKGLYHCSDCKEWFTLDEFYPNPRKKSGVHGQCKPCSIKRVSHYYHADKGRAYQQNRKHYWNNKEHEQEKFKEWYNANAERQCQKARAWHKENYDRVRGKRQEYAKNWRNTRGKEWYSSPEGRFYVNRAAQVRRKRAKLVDSTLTKEEWFEILKVQNYTCLGCNKKFTDILKPTIDHVIPLSKGGGLTKENTQALCRNCNSRKHTKIIDYRLP